ncbi:ral guanine nucleotide dissociation stimulator-like 1 [Heterodontus francisci]|uniref:ral guanine nucleotide dissociation stimulator-like 1 n=1 Tax=Heterodontus francisci TaxID=7792 RepID=UPI00355C6D57
MKPDGPPGINLGTGTDNGKPSPVNPAKSSLLTSAGCAKPKGKLKQKIFNMCPRNDAVSLQSFSSFSRGIYSVLGLVLPHRNSIQDRVREVKEGVVYNVTLKEVQIQQAPNKSARWLGVEGDQVPPGHTSSQSTKKIRAIKADTLQQLGNNLLTASGDGDSNYTRICLLTYRAFASPEAVLDLLLDRRGNLDSPNCEEHGKLRSQEMSAVFRNAIASILQAWLDQFSENFNIPNYTCLQKILKHLRQTMPGSELEKQAQKLLEQFQQQEVAEQELDMIF